MVACGLWRFSRAVVLGIVLGLSGLVTTAPRALAGNNSWPSQVTALYKISFNGLEIGTFQFQTTIGRKATPRAATLRSWPSSACSPGAGLRAYPARSTAQRRTRPAIRSISSRARARARSRRLQAGQHHQRFDDSQDRGHGRDGSSPRTASEGRARSVVRPARAFPRRSRQSLRTKIVIFDGKQRFDLAMSFRRNEKIVEARPSVNQALRPSAASSTRRSRATSRTTIPARSPTRPASRLRSATSRARISWCRTRSQFRPEWVRPC